MLFDKLQVELEAKGYSLVEKEVDGLSLARDPNENLRQEISFNLKSTDKGRPLGSVRTYIHLPICTESYGEKEYADGLTMEFGEAGIFPLGSHLSTGWDTKDFNSIVESIEMHAMPWFDRFSTEENVARYLEEVLDNGLEVKAPEYGKSIIDKVIAKLIFRQSNLSELRGRAVKPPIFNEYLANIYYILGDMDKAVLYMERWVSFNKSMPLVKPYLEKLQSIRGGQWIGSEDNNRR